MSRNIDMMCPKLRQMYQQFHLRMQFARIPYMITSVDRSIVEQMALYVQGRMPLHDVNKFRERARLYRLPVSENRPVTWTLDSAHVTDPFNIKTDDDLSRAFDIAILYKGKPTWDTKVSVNRNEIPDYLEAADIWRDLGGVCGADWSKPDYPHMQIQE